MTTNTETPAWLAHRWSNDAARFDARRDARDDRIRQAVRAGRFTVTQIEAAIARGGISARIGTELLALAQGVTA